MINKIIFAIVMFLSGAFIDAAFFRLPKLQQCFTTSSEIMDVVDYYAIMFERTLMTCEEVIDDNIELTRKHRELSFKNADLINRCRLSGTTINE
jgi:hydroxyacyl-ACP dehydratase HTD2-like protein with hotdog domain